jgi:hypothetical protein
MKRLNIIFVFVTAASVTLSQSAGARHDPTLPIDTGPNDLSLIIQPEETSFLEHARTVKPIEDTSERRPITTAKLPDNSEIAVFMSENSWSKISSVNIEDASFTISYNKAKPGEEPIEGVTGGGVNDILDLLKEAAQRTVRYGRTVVYETISYQDEKTYRPILICENSTSTGLDITGPDKPTKIVICGVSQGSPEIRYIPMR